MIAASKGVVGPLKTVPNRLSKDVSLSDNGS